MIFHGLLFQKMLEQYVQIFWSHHQVHKSQRALRNCYLPIFALVLVTFLTYFSTDPLLNYNDVEHLMCSTSFPRGRKRDWRFFCNKSRYLAATNWSLSFAIVFYSIFMEWKDIHLLHKNSLYHMSNDWFEEMF